MSLKEMIEEWATKESMDANLNKEHGAFFCEGYERGALAMAKHWAGLWVERNKVIAEKILTDPTNYSLSLKLQSIGQQFDACAKEVLRDE